MADQILNVLELKAQLRDEHIETLVHRFYERVAQDELLAPVFASRIEAEEWPPHLEKMVRFWSTILRGTGTTGDPQHYNGNPMIVHHGLAGITPAHFARWLELFREVADEHLPRVLANSILHRAVRMGANLQKAACSE
ncbi:MAG: group III truncated hemoglobin [Planctomycetota bacterium]